MSRASWVATILVLCVAAAAPWQVMAQESVSDTKGRPARSTRHASPTKPQLSLGINCLRDAVVKEGTALLLQVNVDMERGKDSIAVITVSNPAGGWGDLTTIEIRDDAGKLATGLKVAPAFKTDSKILLDGDAMGLLVFAVEPVGGKVLPPGDYKIVAVLDATKGTDNGGWRGKVASPAALLTVKAASATLSEDEAELAALTEIRIHLFFNRIDAALAAVERDLAVSPNDLLLLEAKGDALAKAGRYADAVAVYDSVLEGAAPQAESPLREPPFGLIEKREEAARRIK